MEKLISTENALSDVGGLKIVPIIFSLLIAGVIYAFPSVEIR